MLGDARQHLGAYFFTIMKSKDILWPSRPGQNTMGSAVLSFNTPTDTKQCGKNLMRFC